MVVSSNVRIHRTDHLKADRHSGWFAVCRFVWNVLALRLALYVLR